MHGFKLTDELKAEGFSGGTVQSGPRGEMFNVGEALEKGDGVVYTDDDVFAQVLSSYPALERIPVDEVPETATAVELPYQTVMQTAQQAGPWVPQTSDVAPQQRVEVVGEGEIAAEHADDPANPDQAVQQGEDVSGKSPSDSGRTGSGSSFPSGIGSGSRSGGSAGSPGSDE